MAEVATPENNNANNDLQAQLAEALKRAENAEAEVVKQKNLKDNYAKENAEYKRKEAASMTDEEKREQERKTLEERATNAEKRLAEMEHKQNGLENGFTADEIAKLGACTVDFKALKEIVSARVEEAVKSAKAEFTKNSTSNGLLGNGTTNSADGKSDFQKRQESRQKQNSIVEL